MSSGICRVEKVKTAHDIAGKQIHDRRERDHSNCNPDIDFTRTWMNFCLKNPEGITYNKHIDEYLKENYKGGKAIRKDAIRMVSVLFTSDKEFFENSSLETVHEYFEACFEFAKRHWGENNVFSAFVHMDEKTPHMHLNFIPLTKDGNLSAKAVLGDRRRLQKLQDDFYNEVSKRFGLERGNRCDLDDPNDVPTKHLTVTEFKRKTKSEQLTRELEEKEKQVERIDSEISSKELILGWRKEALEDADATLERLDTEYQEKRENVERIDEQLSAKSAELEKTSAELADNKALLEKSAKKVSQIKSVDSIETKPSFTGKKVIISQEDYGKLSNLAKKQIAAESKENELKKQITALKDDKKKLFLEKEALIEEKGRVEQENRGLRKENNELRSVFGQTAVLKLQAELENLRRKYQEDLDKMKQKYQKVLDFVENLGMTKKLQEFIHPHTKGIGR